MMIYTLMTIMALTGASSGVLANGTAAVEHSQVYEVQTLQEANYSEKVMRAVSETMGMDADSYDAISIINQLPKIKVWEYYLASFGQKVKGNEVRCAVKDIFDIDLDLVSKNDYGSKLVIYPAPVMETLRVSLKQEPTSTKKDELIMSMSKNEVMDRYIKQSNYALTGAQLSLLVNQIFGVNLMGISSLEGKQLAINSKGQWIVKGEQDLVLLESSLDDVDVFVYAGPYLEELTGTKALPEALIVKLTAIGFVYQEENDRLYYRNPTGESVPDAFKGQVIGILLGFIAEVASR
ncbi:hypothetical protein [Planococcus maritimus]|uniref:hypothetical protein n=1 Tax=Planococcus maritimus TaxID=192421 RepID=UPI001F22665F|nr:hypothetical protein [Planococcus maritimus]